LSSEAAIPITRVFSAVSTILRAGVVAGVLDITAALLVYGLFFDLRPTQLLQGIASGLLGARAFQGGLATALLGLACHFFIALSAATVYVAISRQFPFLIQHAIPSGMLYGIAVYLFMNRVVLPLSAVRQAPFSLKMMLIAIGILIVCVGLPISLLVRRYSV
jgi:hypothetical protein